MDPACPSCHSLLAKPKVLEENWDQKDTDSGWDGKTTCFIIIVS